LRASEPATNRTGMAKSPDRIRDGTNGADPVSRVEPTQSARGLRREPAAYQALAGRGCGRARTRAQTLGMAALARSDRFFALHMA
jgi:hypothetical protein